MFSASVIYCSKRSYVEGYKKVFAGLFFVGSHSIRTAVRSLFRNFTELLNETHYGPDFINDHPFEMAPSCVSTTVLYTLLSGQILKTADGNASVNVNVIFWIRQTTKQFEGSDQETQNMILHNLLFCRGIKPHVISHG